jgi:hypothetical protein
MRRPTRTTIAFLLVGLGPLLSLTPLGHAQAQPVRLITIDSLNVRPVLERLWRDSVRDNRELVACLAGAPRGDAFRISRAEPLESLVDVPDSLRGDPAAESDSVSVGTYLTALSIETCRPPEWVGAVHTHSSRVADLRYPKLSPYDERVVSRWHERWRKDSVFCVLFQEGSPPYCEFREGA